MKSQLMTSREKFWFDQGYREGKIEGYHKGCDDMSKKMSKNNQ